MIELILLLLMLLLFMPWLTALLLEIIAPPLALDWLFWFDGIIILKSLIRNCGMFGNILMNSSMKESNAFLDASSTCT